MEGDRNDHRPAQKSDESETLDYECEQGARLSRPDADSSPTTAASDEELACSLYVSRAPNSCQTNRANELSRTNLENAIRASAPLADWQVSETSCGLIAAFARETDAEKLLQRGDLARVFQGPVQVARFSARDSRYRQAVLLRDVPWAIPLQDLSSAFAKQGIATGSIERLRQYVRVEILEADHYEIVLRQGLDFFGAARFSAVPERWWRGGGNGGMTNGSGTSCGNAAPNQAGLPGAVIGNCNLAESSSYGQQGDGVLQCYRCQGFWHVAANCRHLPRCVRCGEPHSVEFCPRPRNSPICCHCSGPHHAGFRQCPVRLQLLNATPISITLSTANRAGSQYPPNPTSKQNASQGQQSLKPNH
ncbi:uncharacterized protein [Venturia canescens]|uniref:uncharacterized protein n=1 Tax=Venturia canescens TaxID=32260 RepID=UPI001C9CF2E9|nr:uncharacterized protein LOC122407229 [Venturia canescens]